MNRAELINQLVITAVINSCDHDWLQVLINSPIILAQFRVRSTLQDAGSMINKSNNKNTSLSLQSCLGGTRFVKVGNLGRVTKVKQPKIALMKENYWEKWEHFFIMINLFQTYSHYVPTTEVFFHNNSVFILNWTQKLFLFP